MLDPERSTSSEPTGSTDPATAGPESAPESEPSTDPGAELGAEQSGPLALGSAEVTAAASSIYVPTSVSSSRAATGPTPVKLAAWSFWTRRVTWANPLASNSAAVVSNLRSQITPYYGGVAAFNVEHYNASFYMVPAGQPRLDITFHDCQGKGSAPTGVYDGAKHFKQVPVPTGAVPANGDDSAMTIYSPSTDQVWEFWKMRKNSLGKWEACWGGRLDQASTKVGYFPYPFGTTATGLVMAAGMVSLADVRKGSIDHAMYLMVRNARVEPHYSYPALRGDGDSWDTNAPMEGQRFRLDPNLDLSKYNLTPVGRMVAVAAQKYGFIVGDKGGAVGIIAESGALETRLTGKDPWDSLLTTPTYEVLRNFPWDKVQALPKDYSKPS